MVTVVLSVWAEARKGAIRDFQTVPEDDLIFEGGHKVGVRVAQFGSQLYIAQALCSRTMVVLVAPTLVVLVVVLVQVGVVG